MAQAAVALDREAFSCAICLDLLKDPATLSCGHSYCMRCIHDHWDEEEEKQEYSCPQCRHSFISRPVLVKNTMLAVLVEQLEKSGPPVDICSEHNEVKKMFCRTDQQLLCVVCCMDKHAGHRTVSAAAERAEMQAKLEVRLDKIHQMIHSKETGLDRASEETFTILIHVMKERQAEVEQQIRTQQENEETRLQEHQQELQSDISELKRTQTYPEVSPAEATPIFPTQPPGSFEHVTAALSTLSDLLQQTLKEGLDNISQAPTQVEQLLAQSEKPLPQAHSTVPLLLDQPERPLNLNEPTTRKGFLKYAKEITLDLNTAHRQLSLSDENRRATFEEDANRYPKNPNRFSYYYQVLSRQRLTGRCYWEVKWDTSATNWSDSTITIAVCYNNIKRKDKSDECRFGFNENSWALQCSRDDDYTFYFNEDETDVYGPTSSRIGVYLDHSSGILSFYSVTTSMNLLHRVETSFTQPLYAGLKFESSDHGATAYFPKLK
uniref:Tripartite motif-containing protein 16-like n=1 Tax=Periophthalmus magnuspinnatus TaxID=409849 RepID=A0A3B3ZCN9_9GOBI